MGFDKINNKLNNIRTSARNLEARAANSSERTANIVDKLDAKDGKKDGKISASVWSEYSGQKQTTDISAKDAEMMINQQLESKQDTALRESKAKDQERYLKEQKFGL